MKIYLKQLYTEKGEKIPITLPVRSSEVAAGYDIFATSDPKIVGLSGKYKDSWNRIDYIEYQTNLYIAPSAVTYHTLIHPRSSISNYDLVLANSIGLIDNDYRGMVICRFKYIWQPVLSFVVESDPHNHLVTTVDYDKLYKRGDKIAQLVIEPTVMVEWELVDELNQTQRGDGGFGSTDKPKIEPKHDASRIVVGKSLADLYNEAGGIAVKEKYLEEIKGRE